MSETEPKQALNLDVDQQQNFVRYYRNLPEKPASTVRFFCRGEYYTVHGDDCEIVTQITSNLIKFMGLEPKLSYTTLSKTNFERVIRELLLQRQYRVEVYVKAAVTKNNSWNLEYKGSPGNLTQFEDVLFESNEITYTNYVMSVKFIKNKVLAIATVCITEGKFELCELNDNECFSELEAIIAQVSPRECIIPSGDTPELVSLKTVLDRNGILTAKVKRSDFNCDDIMQDLDRLLFFQEGQQRNAAARPETNLSEALGSLQALIRFLNLTADKQNFNQFKLSTLDVQRFVRLDNAALQALNVFPKARTDALSQSYSSKNTNCLLGILDMCATSQGKRLLEMWIKHPLRDYNLINERLDIVEALIKNTEVRQTIVKDCLTRISDMIILSRKLLSKKATLKDCHRVYETVNSIPRLLSTLKHLENKSVKAKIIDPIEEISTDMEKYQSMVEQVLDFDLVERGEYFIQASFDDELKELKNKKDKLEEKIQRVLSHVADDLNLEEGKSIKLECNDQYGYFFRVTIKEEQILRKNKKYEIINVIKGGVRFRNEKLTEINEDYSEIKKKYEEQQQNVVKDILEVAAGYADSLRNLNMCLATIDVLAAFANASYSSRVPYVRPKIHKDEVGILKLKKVRHPCIELQDCVTFVPNDAEFNKTGKTFHIITGPNMCGKSTYIRSIGIAVLMAHIGCFVPCEEAEISIVDGILARVGADDCQLKGLSTFMLEMIETSTIIKSATQNSLVIIDELGRGTSTYDGCGIAWSIAEYLAKDLKCFGLFATHFHEITELEELVPSVNNLHVTAVTSENTITPLYQIREGSCDNSYGIHCARMAGFPEEVIQDAEEQLKQLENHDGLRFIKDYESSLKRKVMKEGDEIIKSTLEKVKNIDIDNMTDDDLQEYIESLKTELVATENQFIKGLITK